MYARHAALKTLGKIHSQPHGGAGAHPGGEVAHAGGAVAHAGGAVAYSGDGGKVAAHSQWWETQWRWQKQRRPKVASCELWIRGAAAVLGLRASIPLMMMPKHLLASVLRWACGGVARTRSCDVRFK